MNQDDKSELEKRIGHWDLPAQQKEMLKILAENSKKLKQLKKKLELLAGRIEDLTKV